MKEISPENLSNLEKQYRATAIIVFAQIGFVVLLTIIAWFVVSEKEETAVSQQTVTTLWMAVIFVAIVTFILRRMFFQWDRLRDAALLKGIPGVLNKLRANAIILGALAEAIAVLGFVIAFLSGAKVEMLRAGIAALIVILINFPRKSVWEKIVANMQEI